VHLEEAIYGITQRKDACTLWVIGTDTNLLEELAEVVAAEVELRAHDDQD